jgi:hypothetical protein
VLGVPTILLLLDNLLEDSKKSTLDNLKMKQVTYQVTTTTSLAITTITTTITTTCEQSPNK